MKKLFLLLFITPLLFISCSSDDDNEDNEELKFIQIRVTSEDTPTPNGNVYLFKVNGYDIESDQPNAWAIDYTPVLFYKHNGESKPMTPVSKYGSQSKGDLLISEKDGCSIHSIFWYELSSTYGAPKAGDEYLVFVDLRNGTYARASKRFTIKKNSTITIKLPTCKDKSQFVDAEWSIQDYTGL